MFSNRTFGLSVAQGARHCYPTHTQLARLLTALFAAMLLPNLAWAGEGEDPCTLWEADGFRSTLLSVGPDGCNSLIDDNSNPSIAIDPENPDRVVVTWRQIPDNTFDRIDAPISYSSDRGATWSHRGSVSNAHRFESSRVAAGSDGAFYHISAARPSHNIQLFRSEDGGATWTGPSWTFYVPNGSPASIIVDHSRSARRGNIYVTLAGFSTFFRSVDGGVTFQESVPSTIGDQGVGAPALAAHGGVFYLDRVVSHNPLVNSLHVSENGSDGKVPRPGFRDVPIPYDRGTNDQASLTAGILRSDGRQPLFSCGMQVAQHGYFAEVYKTLDDGQSWLQPVRATPFFGARSHPLLPTIGVAADGRIDLVFATEVSNYSFRIQHTFSRDEGMTWSVPAVVTPIYSTYRDGFFSTFPLFVIASDARGVHLVFQASRSPWRDIWYRRIEVPSDCNGNGIEDWQDLNPFTSNDCDANEVPDECQADCNANQTPDVCDLIEDRSVDRDANGVPDECQSVMYVAHGNRSVQDGTSWQTAYSTLDAALAEARRTRPRPFEIRVASGVYSPDAGTGDRTRSFELVSGVSIVGGFEGGSEDPERRDLNAYPTILSGDLQNDDELGDENRTDNSVHVVRARYTDSRTTLDGLVIRGGHADQMLPGDPAVGGAGFIMLNAALTLKNCQVRHNRTSGQGGGIRAFESSLAASHSDFHANTAATGAAMAWLDTGLTLRHSKVSANVGAAAFYGRQATFAPAVTLLGCTIAANSESPFDFETRTSRSFDSIIVTNNGLPMPAISRTVQLDSSCVDAAAPTRAPGVGNMFLCNPQFLDPIGPDGMPRSGDEDLRLADGSPAINRGRPGEANPPDLHDLDGGARVRGCRMDMGAYESPWPEGLGDIQGDGRRDLLDFALLRECLVDAAFPPTPSTSCTCGFDFDADAEITLRDFAAWQNAMNLDF